jgi:agmatine deiminase
VPQVEEIFLQMIAALVPHEVVNLLVDDGAAEQAVRARCKFAGAENINFYRLPTVDSWIRDYGPNFLISEITMSDRLQFVADSGKEPIASKNDKLKFVGHLAYNDWVFNAWGNKYEELKKDNSIPSQLEAVLGVPRFEPGIVMEGGSIEVNGAGVVLTTEQCLLNRNRNPHLNREQIEEFLKGYLGVRKVLWLAEGVVGDDTDGHIDDLARFVSPTKIVCAVEEDPSDPNFEILQENLQRLRQMTDTHGRFFEIVTLPMPSVVGGASTDTRNLDRLPASYANFYIANNVVLAPIFGHANDARALAALQNLFPDRLVVGINCEPLVWGMGTIHCVTQQQPAP